MSRVVGVAPGTADREAAFAELWHRANSMAPGQVKAAGGFRVRVPNEVAEQLIAARSSDTPEPTSTEADCPPGSERCPECGKCLKDVSGHLSRVHNIDTP